MTRERVRQIEAKGPAQAAASQPCKNACGIIWMSEQIIIAAACALAILEETLFLYLQLRKACELF